MSLGNWRLLWEPRCYTDIKIAFEVIDV